MLLKRHFRFKDTNKMKVKEQGKINANSNQKRTGVVSLVIDSTNIY